MTFANPVYLWLFLGVFLIIFTYFVNFGWNRRKGLSFANYSVIARVAGRKIFPRNNLQFVLKTVILSFIIFALAGLTIWYEGFGLDSDVVFAIDSSASMLADDYTPSRLEVAKTTAMDLISLLDQSVNIGIVSFAGTPIIKQPMSKDKLTIKDTIKEIDVITIGGTAIGETIVLSSNMLSFSDKGKTAILITDGQNNVGINPKDAAVYANERGVIVNTIGVATEEGGKFAGASAISQLDIETLREIAEKTGGNFYHAKTKEELKIAILDIFNSEKIKINVDAKIHLLLIAVLLFFIEWILTNTRYRVVP